MAVKHHARPYKSVTYKIDLLQKTLRPLNRPVQARTVQPAGRIVRLLRLDGSGELGQVVPICMKVEELIGQ